MTSYYNYHSKNIHILVQLLLLKTKLLIFNFPTLLTAIENTFVFNFLFEKDANYLEVIVVLIYLFIVYCFKYNFLFNFGRVYNAGY